MATPPHWYLCPNKLITQIQCEFNRCNRLTHQAGVGISKASNPSLPIATEEFPLKLSMERSSFCIKLVVVQLRIRMKVYVGNDLYAQMSYLIGDK